MPFTAVAVVLPTKVAPALTVAVTTVELSAVTMLPPLSWSDTWGWVVNAAPDAVPIGVRTEIICVGSDCTTIALFAPSDPVAPGTGSVNIASFPTASEMLPPFSSSEVVET